MLRPPLPAEPDPPAEPIVVLVRVWADGRTTREPMPASLAVALALHGPDNGGAVKSARVVFAGALDRWGSSA